MIKKIKFLILALLGISIIPTATNAYELSNTLKKDQVLSSEHFVLYQKSCLNPGNNREWILRTSSYYPDIVRNQNSCPEWYTLGNYYADDRDGASNSPIMILGTYRYITVSKNGAWLDFWRTSMTNNTQTLHKFSVPSTTAYQYTTVWWQKFMLSQVYYYHNQFFLYDPTTRFWVSFLGKMKIENWMLLVDPRATADNLWFVNFQRKKAWSMTTTKSWAYKWLLWIDISKDRLESLEFTKSYSLEEWGDRFLPRQFSYYDQGETVGWIYNEDTEFVSPDFKGNANNQNGAEAHRECINYYTRMHNLARFSDKCSGNGYDDQAMENFLAVKNWNWEWDKPQLTGSSAWVCGIYADKKKEYKELYKEQWTDFEKEFNEFMFSPEALIPANKCKHLEVQNPWLVDSIKSILWTVGNSIAPGVSQLEFEKDLWKYILFKKACFSKSYMPTPLDKWHESLAGLLYLAGDNNENVCNYAAQLKQWLIDKYWSLVFPEDYQKKIKNDLKDDVFLENKLNIEKVDTVIKNLPLDTVIEKKDAGQSIVSFLKNDYQKGINESSALFGYKHCWNWIWVKERDYIVYFPLILLFVYVIWKH